MGAFLDHDGLDSDKVENSPDKHHEKDKVGVVFGMKTHWSVGFTDWDVFMPTEHYASVSKASGVVY